MVNEWWLPEYTCLQRRQGSAVDVARSLWQCDWPSSAFTTPNLPPRLGKSYNVQLGYSIIYMQMIIFADVWNCHLVLTHWWALHLRLATARDIGQWRGSARKTDGYFFRISECKTTRGSAIAEKAPCIRARVRVWIIIIIIKGIYIGLAQVRKGHKCAMSAEMAVWLRNCLCLYS